MTDRRGFLTGLGLTALAAGCATKGKDLCCGAAADWSYDGQTTLNLTSPLVTERVRLRVLADMHLTLADVRDAAFASHYRRMAQWGAKPSEFEAALPQPSACDFLVLAGDNLSFPTLANVEYLKGRLDACGVPYGYVAGNHDWHFEGEPGSDFERRERWAKELLPSTWAFRKAVLETPSLVAVLAGHEHRFMASSLADKLQFVAPGNGAFLDVILLPDSSGCSKGG